MRLFRHLMTLGLLGMGALWCESAEDQPGYRTEHPLQVVDVNHLYMSPSRTRLGNFTFNDTNATLNTRIGSWSSGEAGIITGVRNIELGLGHKIHSCDTPYAVLGAQGVYRGVDRWLWLGNLTFQSDVRHADFFRWSRYIASLNGRYSFTEKTGFYVGFYSEIGMRATIVHPIVGADYTQGNWVYQAIYPIKAGVSYQGLKSNLISFMIRPFYTGLRVDRGPYKNKSVAVYRGTGAEVRWDWQRTALCDIWATIGHTINGELSVGDKCNHHRHDIHLKQVPYLQLGITIGL